MALKDAIDKIVSYFDTDEVTDYEDAAKEEAKARPVKARPVKAQRPVQTPPDVYKRQTKSCGTSYFYRCTPNRIFTFLYFTLVKTKGSHCIRNKKCSTRRCESCKWNS